MERSVGHVHARALRTVLWIAFMVVTVAALTILAMAIGHWWPSGNDWYLSAFMAVTLLLVTGCIWGISTIVSMRRHRHVTWWMFAWPLFTAIGVIVALASTPNFDDSRPQFEKIAKELLITPDLETLDGLRIGRFEVGNIYEFPMGEVYFTDARQTAFMTESGWVYSPNGIPTSREGDFSVENIGGPWYRYTLVINY